MSRNKTVVTVVVALILLGGGKGLSTEQVKSAIQDVKAASQQHANPTTASPAGSALAALDTLPVKGKQPLTGYSRAQYGQAWTDDNTVALGHNGCDTRNDVLTRDLTNRTYRNAHSCAVKTGTLRDPYTGRTIQFVRGSGSSAVQIDHVVALAASWRTGAQNLTPAQRVNLANDPLNLLAVDGPTNQAKGDGDAATWLPPNKSIRAKYAANQIAVKKKYGLWVTPAERDALRRLLTPAPNTSLPAGAGGMTIP